MRCRFKFSFDQGQFGNEFCGAEFSFQANSSFSMIGVPPPFGPIAFQTLDAKNRHRLSSSANQSLRNSGLYRAKNQSIDQARLGSKRSSFFPFPKAIAFTGQMPSNTGNANPTISRSLLSGQQTRNNRTFICVAFRHSSTAAEFRDARSVIAIWPWFLKLAPRHLLGWLPGLLLS